MARPASSIAESGVVRGQYHPIFSKHNIAVTSGGGPLKAVGYQRPINVTMTAEQAARYDQLIAAGIDPRRALEMVGGAAAGQLLARVGTGIGEAGAGFLAGAAVGSLPGAIIGSIVGGLAGAFGGFGGGPKTVTRTIPGRAGRVAEHQPTAPADEMMMAATPSGKPVAMKKNYRVLDMRGMQGNIQSGTPVASFETPHIPISKGGVIAEGAITVEEAARKILEGQGWSSLTTPEKAALVGAVLGGITGPQDAAVGAGIGALAAQLGTSIEDVFGRLRAKLGIQPTPTVEEARRPLVAPQPYTPPPTPPTPPPAGPIIAPQPTQPIFGQPHETIPPLAPQPGSPPPMVPPGPQPSGDCTTPDSELGQLARLLWNCPTFQQEMKDKLTVTQRPGHAPELTIKEPVCLCCESEADLQAYAESGGLRGRCTMTHAADAAMVSKAS